MARKQIIALLCLAVLCGNLQTAHSRTVQDLEQGQDDLTDLTGRLRQVGSHRGSAVRVNPVRRRAHYKLRLRIPDLQMSKELADPESDQYKELTSRLTASLEQLLADLPGTKRVYNMRYRGPADSATERSRHPDPDLRSRVSVRVLSKSRHSPDSGSRQTIATEQTIESPSSYRPSSSSSSSSPSSTSTFESVPSGNDMGEDVREESTLSDQSSTFFSPEDSDSDQATVSGVHSGNAQSVVAEVSTDHSDHQSTPAEGASSFHVPTLTNNFKKCFGSVDNDGNYVLELQCYIQAYSELLGVFNLLGPVFTFAADDVRSKLGTLAELGRESPNHYRTFHTMFAYEFSPQGAQAEHRGVNANRWIHRALKFISGLVKAIAEPEAEGALSARAGQVYTDTLAPHHSWYVRMGVGVALLALPSREYLMGQMNVTGDTVGRQQLADLTSVIDAVYEEVQKLYNRYPK